MAIPSTIVVQIDQLRSQHLLAAEREQLTRQRCGAIRRTCDLLGAIASRVHTFVEVDQHQLGVAADRREQVVEVVCDATGEPADRFHLLRLAQLLFESLARGHVAARGEDVLWLPVRADDHTADRVEQDPAAIGVADPDRGGSKLALYRLPEHLLGAGEIVRVDESREVRPHHLLRGDAECSERPRAT